MNHVIDNLKRLYKDWTDEEVISVSPIAQSGKLTLQHLRRFRAEAKQHGSSSGGISPMILPAYTRKEPERTVNG